MRLVFIQPLLAPKRSICSLPFFLQREDEHKNYFCKNFYGNIKKNFELNQITSGFVDKTLQILIPRTVK